MSASVEPLHVQQIHGLQIKMGILLNQIAVGEHGSIKGQL